MNEFKNIYTNAFGKVYTPKEQHEIMCENYGKMCLEYAGVCRRYRAMLDDKDKENVRLKEELANYQNMLFSKERQIRALQEELAKLKELLQNPIEL